MLLRHQTTVPFDPSIKKHREAVGAFMKRGAWVDTDMRFAHDPDFSNVAHQVQTKLLRWYLHQEENRAKKKIPVQN